MDFATGLSAGVLLFTVLAAAAYDLRLRIIPNWLTLGGMVAGLALNTAMGGLPGLRASGAGLALGFCGYLCLYCLRAMGAGDVKLMGAVGSMAGPAAWFGIAMATAFAAGLLAIGLALSHGRLRSTLRNVRLIFSELIHGRPPHRRFGELDVKHASALKMPHGVAIAAGVIGYGLWVRAW